MINNIDTNALDGARNAIRATPAAGLATYGVNLKWKTGTQAVVSTLPMKLGAEEIERDFTWVIDEPPQLLGQSKGPTPQEYLMSGVGACIMVGFVVNAAVKGVSIDHLDVEVKGGLDLAGFLNLREGAEIKMTGIEYNIIVAADAPKEVLEEIASAAYNFSPNAMTVTHGIPVKGALSIAKSRAKADA